jgi:hypothetical protein
MARSWWIHAAVGLVAGGAALAALAPREAFAQG